jgi:aspartate/methionine/tyrosine aminotransferase
MPRPLLARRMSQFDSSGIRKVFDLAARMKDPINLSIGQPDFDVPEPIRRAATHAIEHRKNGYSVTQGIAELREKLQRQVDAAYRHSDRKVVITSGTSGGLVLVMTALVDPGDEVIVFDPFFVMYPALVAMVGGRCVYVDTREDFSIDVQRVADAITPRTKLILFNSPANPTGAVTSGGEMQALAQLAAEREIVLLSDEIYQRFCYDQPFTSPAEYNDRTLVLDGFSKTYAMTGWRLGFAHGPSEIIDAMTKCQQYTFVCAPQPVQWAGIAALDVDMQSYIDAYRHKRDMLYDGLKDCYQLVRPDGAFYAFPRAPRGMTGTDFVTAAIEQGLLIIPGNIFSRRDTHFRLSYAASDQTIERGVEVLRRLA